MPPGYLVEITYETMSFGEYFICADSVVGAMVNAARQAAREFNFPDFTLLYAEILQAS